VTHTLTWEADVAQVVNKFRSFYETLSWLPTCTRACKLSESNLHPPLQFLQDTSTLRFTESSLSFTCSYQNIACPSLLFLRVLHTPPVSLPIDLVTLITESFISWDLVLCRSLEVNRLFGGLSTDLKALYGMSQEERSIFREVIVSVILSKKVYMYIHVCPIPNGFRDRAISLYSFKIVDKKEILRTVSDTGIYCSSEKNWYSLPKTKN
jgi:hypothetical protein